MSVARPAVVIACAAATFMLALAALRLFASLDCLNRDGAWIAAQWTCKNVRDFTSLTFATAIGLASACALAAGAIAARVSRRKLR
jgi:hypothetical protein